jgi:aldehyde dehydrogenase (NAD+)
MKLNNTKIVIYQKEYFRSGHTRNYAFRRDALNKLDKALDQYESELLQALEEDFGKNRIESFLTEIFTTRGEIKDALRNLKRWMKPRVKMLSGIAQFPAGSKVISEPLGQVLIISPWNYPVHLALAPLVGAISGGNCSIIKTSELAPQVSKVLRKMIAASFDPGFISVVEGGVEETTSLLKEKFNHIFFTGSTRVGKIIMKAASENLTSLTLELGGKSPCIVDETAKLSTAARRIIWGKLINAGQTCIAPDYLLVHKDVKDKLLEEMKSAVKEYYGDSPADSPDLARIINDNHYQRLKSLIDPAKVYLGGEWNDSSRYIAPTIIDGADWDDEIMNEEIFGPLLPVISFDNFDELRDLLIRRPSPLAMYLFSENKKRQREFMSSLSFGGGCINDTLMHMTDSRFPFGGVGDSGMGNYHGKAGFRTFTHEKTVLKNTTLFNLPFRYPPYKKGIVGLLKSL